MRLYLGSRGFAQAGRGSRRRARRRRGLGDDEIEAERIQPAHGGEEAGGGFAGIVARRKDFHREELRGAGPRGSRRGGRRVRALPCVRLGGVAGGDGAACAGA